MLFWRLVSCKEWLMPDSEPNDAEHQVIRFDVLPDDVLLEIFDFYVDTTSSYYREEVEAWQTLVHVCSRWRNVVFQSPRRLNLRLFCSPEIRTRDKLDVWPALPLIVTGNMALSGTDNIIAALEQSNRVCQLDLSGLEDRKYEEFSAVMQVPFPELTDLRLSSRGVTSLVIPNSFLGGSASGLRRFSLEAVPFPELPNLLLSATHLVELCLTDIPDSGYISPEAIVAPLSTLFSLESLHLDIQWETRRQPSPLPSPKRSILPTLKCFYFEGVIEYLEDLVTLIDTPRLISVEIKLPNEPEFDIQRLVQFINRTPKLREHHEAHVEFNARNVRILFGTLRIVVPRNEPDQRLLSVAQVSNSSLFPVSTVVDLYIDRRYLPLQWTYDAIENTLWLRALLPFSAVKNLYIRKAFASSIAAALQELVGDRTIEVLLSLQNIFVEELESFEENFSQFVVARQLSGHPVTISDWDKYSA